MGKLDDMKTASLAQARATGRPASDSIDRYTPEYVEALIQKLSERIDELEAQVNALKK